MEVKHRRDFGWNQQAEDQSGKEANVVDQDGYQVVKRSRVLGNFVPEISVVDRFANTGFKTISGSMGSRRSHRVQSLRHRESG